MSVNKICFLGAGRAGRALAILFSKKGIGDITIWNRSVISDEKLLIKNSVNVIYDINLEFVKTFDIIIISVSDQAIEEVFKKIKPYILPHRTVLTLSGFFSFKKDAGLSATNLGSMHPVFPFSAFSSHIEQNGLKMIFAIEGGEKAKTKARELCNKINATYFFISSEQKIGYHAAMALLSNGTVGLFFEAEKLLLHAGVPVANIKDSLLNLLKATVANIESLDTGSALTGPAVRGDNDLIKAHHAYLHDFSSSTAELYDAMTKILFEIVNSKEKKNEKG